MDSQSGWPLRVAAARAVWLAVDAKNYNIIACFPVTPSPGVFRFVCRVLFCSTAQLSSASVPTLSGLDRLAAEGGGGGGAGYSDPSSGKKGNRFFKSLGFGSSKQAEANDYTHMRYNRRGMTP